MTPRPARPPGLLPLAVPLPPAGLLALLALLALALPARAQYATVAVWGHACTLEAEFVDHHTFVRGPAPRGAAAARRSAAFEVEYVNVPPAARAAFEVAVALWSEHVASPVPIRVRVRFESLEENVLGSAAPRLIANFIGTLDPDTFFPTALANALAGRDLDPENPDFEVAVNATFPRWYFGTDGAPPENLFDFVTVALHEIGHGLGFFGSMRVTGGAGRWGEGQRGFPAIYDRFSETDLDGPPIPLLDTRRFPNPSPALAAALQSTEVYFAGATGTRAQVESQAAQGLPVGPGGRPKLHAPAEWRPGSSYSHLTELRDANNAEIYYPPGSLNSLMTPRLGATEVVRTPGPVVCGMFRDMGWRMGAACEALLPPDPPPLEAPLVVVGPCVNPVRAGGRTGVAVHVREQSRVRVDVYDVLGRRVARAFDGVRPAGEALGGARACAPSSRAFVEVPTGGLASGVYVVRVTTAEAAEAVRMTVVR